MKSALQRERARALNPPWSTELLNVTYLPSRTALGVDRWGSDAAIVVWMDQGAPGPGGIE